MRFSSVFWVLATTILLTLLAGGAGAVTINPYTTINASSAGAITFDNIGVNCTKVTYDSTYIQLDSCEYTRLGTPYSFTLLNYTRSATVDANAWVVPSINTVTHVGSCTIGKPCRARAQITTNDCSVYDKLEISTSDPYGDVLENSTAPTLVVDTGTECTYDTGGFTSNTQGEHTITVEYQSGQGITTSDSSYSFVVQQEGVAASGGGSGPGVINQPLVNDSVDDAVNNLLSIGGDEGNGFFGNIAILVLVLIVFVLSLGAYFLLR